MRNDILITSTLPYPSGKGAHAGHLLEFVFCDVLARYLRKTNDVVFNVGLDEHGAKIADCAKDMDMVPQEYVDHMTEVWEDFCAKFDISYDVFYRTSSPSHTKNVQTIWNWFMESGDIYKKHYRGHYCKGCESYKTVKDLVDERCPEHDVDGMVSIVEEENYFFRLSKYKDAVREYIKESPDFLYPHSKRNELLNLAYDSEDISVSRSRLGNEWNVPVPGDDTQVIYIWYSALLSYLFSAGYLKNSFTWDRVIQVCGPDNLRFQGVIFQSFLKVLKVQYTEKLLVHGTILDESGRKMSKTMGNVVEPLVQLEKYGVDAVRYYCVAVLSNYSNSSWVEQDLVNRFNADICDDWGNLVARVLHLVDTKVDGYFDYTEYVEEGFVAAVHRMINEYFDSMNRFDMNGAFVTLNQAVKFANQYINEYKPWKMDDCRVVLANLMILLDRVNHEYKVLFPERSADVEKAMFERKKAIIFKKVGI